jgi:hypothetical protein
LAVALLKDVLKVSFDDIVALVLASAREISDAGKLGVEVHDDVIGIEPSHPAHLSGHATTFEDSRPEVNVLLGDRCTHWLSNNNSPETGFLSLEE